MLTREQVLQGTQDEWELFAELIAGLDDSQWTTPTRCDGWEVRDVAGHVVGTAVDVLAGTFGQRTPDDQARDGRAHSQREMAAELRRAAAGMLPLAAALDNDNVWHSPSPVPDLTMAEGILALMYDTWLHADDIRSALDLPSIRGTGLVAAVEHVRQVLSKRSWGPARLALHGLPELSVGEPNGGTPVVADPMRFVIVATGRAPSAELNLDPTVNIYA